MPTEAGRVEEGIRLVDPAAGGDGGEVVGGPAVPGGSGLLDELVDAEGAEPFGLRDLGEDGQAGGGRRPVERLEGDVGGDVLGTGVVER